MRNPIAIFICFSALAVSSNASCPDNYPLVSPPLNILEGQYLTLKAPTGWKITKPDPQINWTYSSYCFSLVSEHRSALTDSCIKVEILMHAISRARRHGDFDGTKFETDSGLHGFINYQVFQPGTRDWYFAIPVVSTEGAIIVRVSLSKGSISEQRSFACELYRSICFVSQKPKNIGANQSLERTPLGLPGCMGLPCMVSLSSSR